jgi:hypothetical protein
MEILTGDGDESKSLARKNIGRHARELSNGSRRG